MKKILLSAILMLGLGCGSVFAQGPQMNRGPQGPNRNPGMQSPSMNRGFSNPGMNPGNAPRTFQPGVQAPRPAVQPAQHYAPAPSPIHRGQSPQYMRPAAPGHIPPPMHCPPPPAPCPPPRPSLFHAIISLFK
ncbi:MAG: hypothetical protein Q4G69_11950 [Planctomycetia bacterium]|nr:hypothetical protein [Planctomycetia bacterium]